MYLLYTVLYFQLERHAAGKSVGSELCVCVSIASFYLAAHFSRLPLEVCTEALSISPFLTLSSSYLFHSTSLPQSCCFPCISRPSLALQIHLSVALSLCKAFFRYSGFAISERQRLPWFSNPCFYPSFSLSLPFFPCSLHSAPPFFCLCLSWEHCYQKR